MAHAAVCVYRVAQAFRHRRPPFPTTLRGPRRGDISAPAATGRCPRVPPHDPGLLSCSLELPSRFDAAYASIVDKSVQALGEQIRVFQCIDTGTRPPIDCISSEPEAAYLPGVKLTLLLAPLPLLTSCCRLESVVLEIGGRLDSDILRRWSKSIAFLSSLPACVAHVKFVCSGNWRDDASLFTKIQELDWAEFGRSLQHHKSLNLLEIFSRSMFHMSCHVHFQSNPSACASILEELPLRLHSIIKFV